MIILKLGFFCSSFLPIIRLNKRKLVNFFYYTFIIPLILFLFLTYSSSLSSLFSSYGLVFIALVILLWIPTIYARYQRSFWSKFSLHTLRLSWLMVFLYIVFNRQSLLSLFVFFELSLVPIISILFIGGRSFKKFEAGLYIFAFTSSTAFIFLIFLVLRSLNQHGIHQFRLTTTCSFNSSLVLVENYISSSILIYNLTTIVILVKTPLFFLHIWLPKAHVEAPVFASIILARLLLKTGGYGYLILVTNHLGVLAQYDWLMCGILLIAILPAVRCSTQVDVKILIAYSSVNHIAIILCGVIWGFSCSVLGRVILMVGHGVLSSALFFLASDSYTQMRTRSSFFSLVLGKANTNLFSWLMITLINAGLPPFLIFIGEVLILKAVLFHPLLIFLFLINYILIGYYSCLILVKIILSKFPTNVGRLDGVGLNPFICRMIVLIHFLVLINLTISYPWLR